MKVSTYVLAALAVLLFPFLYWKFFVNYGPYFIYCPVVVPVALVAVAGIIYSYAKKNYDLLVYFLILFVGAIFVGHLIRGIFLPTIIVN